MCIIPKQDKWPEKELKTIKDIEELIELFEEKKWVFRGQNDYGTLFAPIDRKPLDKLSRIEKLQYEEKCLIWS